MSLNLKMIQVNIWKGKFLDALVDFLRKENPDIITMQEVTAGEENSCADKTLDLFIYLRDALSLSGVVVRTFGFHGDTYAYHGSAIFVKGDIVSQKEVWLRPYTELPQTYEDNPVSWPLLSRSLLDATICIQNKTMHIISVHGAWNKEPVDTVENVRQAELIAAHIRTLRGEPFLLGGDLNMTPETQVIRTIDAVAQNAMKNLGMKSTLHPTIHKTAKEKPDGLLVDYIYTSPHFTVEKMSVPIVAVSDHLPVVGVLQYTK
ncbi:MAG: endonuclease/exonuclease/phosphatase family protein [bacterium]|nr:endonuclease/exonuclease/phosphatase family protein [bacterium]